MTSPSVDSMARVLRNAAESFPIEPFGSELADVATAYAVQRTNTTLRVALGDHLVGRKIGLTSPVAQHRFGIDEPVYGSLFATNAYVDGQTLAMDAVMQPRVEAEIALVLGRDLDREGMTLADVITATAYCLPAIEVCGSRIANWQIDLHNMIADNAAGGGFVLGTTPKRLTDLDLRGVEMALTRARGEQREVVSQGNGSGCLGSPVIAALWLAHTLVADGMPLRAGDILMTGSLGPMVDADPGAAFEAVFSGLGSVRVGFQR